MLAIAPLQDVLSLGNEARMNKPGVAEGNWRWRFRLDQFRPDVIERLARTHDALQPRADSCEAASGRTACSVTVAVLVLPLLVPRHLDGFEELLVRLGRLARRTLPGSAPTCAGR